MLPAGDQDEVELLFHLITSTVLRFDRVLAGKPEGKRPFDDAGDVKMDEGRRGVDWIDLAYGRDKWRTLVNAVMKHRVP